MAEAWFGTNYQGVDEAVKAMEERKNQPSRFWMKAGETRNILFLDETGFTFNEHKWQRIPNDWKTTEIETCPGVGCPLCQQGNQRILVVVHTIIDFTGYIDNEGKERDKGKKHIFAMNVTVANLLRESKKNWGGLKGHMIRATRKTDKDARCGSAFDHCLKNGQAVVYNLEDVAARGIDITPFNYQEIFAPKSLDALKARYGRISFSPDDVALPSSPSSAKGSEFDARASSQEFGDVPF